MGTETTLPIPIHIAAFESIISQYQETAHSSGDLQAMQYGKGAESGKATNTGSSSIITPSNSDFIIDVENSAKRSLNWAEFQHFKEYYKSGDIVVEEGSTLLLKDNQDEYPELIALDLSMREKLGKRLIAIGIYPLPPYKKAVDVRAPKPGKIRWSHLYGN